MYSDFETEYYCPLFDLEKDDMETAEIVKLLKESRSDLLLMNLSAPKQKIFVEKYRRKFEIPVIFGAGIAIDYFAGRIKLALIWINNIGMKWLYRMIQEPKRLFKRYITHDLPILISMLKWEKQYRRTATIA